MMWYHVGNLFMSTVLKLQRDPDSLIEITGPRFPNMHQHTSSETLPIIIQVKNCGPFPCPVLSSGSGLGFCKSELAKAQPEPEPGLSAQAGTSFELE